MQQPNFGFGGTPVNYKSADDPKKRIKIILFVVGIIIVLSSAAYFIFGNNQDPSRQPMVDLVAQQNETVRLSEEFASSLTSRQLKGHDAELILVMVTQSRDVLADLNRLHGVRDVGGRQRAIMDSQNQELLSSSISLGTIDREFARVMTDRLAHQLQLAQTSADLVEDQQTKDRLAQVATNTVEMRNRFSQIAGN